jgi:hypothetical protein
VGSLGRCRSSPSATPTRQAQEEGRIVTGRGRTTARGLGWSHQQRRAQLLAAHTDGTPCPCQPGCGPNCPCISTGGLPMYRDSRLNVDRMPLKADHTIARSRGGIRADRLMLATCNGHEETGPEAKSNAGTCKGRKPLRCNRIRATLSLYGTTQFARRKLESRFPFFRIANLS